MQTCISAIATQGPNTSSLPPNALPPFHGSKHGQKPHGSHTPHGSSDVCTTDVVRKCLNSGTLMQPVSICTKLSGCATVCAYPHHEFAIFPDMLMIWWKGRSCDLAWRSSASPCLLASLRLPLSSPPTLRASISTRHEDPER